MGVSLFMQRILGFASAAQYAPISIGGFCIYAVIHAAWRPTFSTF